MKSKIKVSVIVCTRNRIDELSRFSESLFTQELLPDEFIIIDSTNQITREYEERISLIIDNPKKVNVIYKKSKPGLTVQRNEGVKYAGGDIVYFFDDDIVLYNNFLKEMTCTFESNPEYYAGMGKIVDESRIKIKAKIINSIKRLLLQQSYGDGKFFRSGFAKLPHRSEKFLETEVLSGGLTGYRREVFSEFSFDEVLAGYSYMEDDDYSKRISEKYKLFFNPAAKCLHLHGQGGRYDMVSNRKMLMVNFRYLFFKNIYKKKALNLLCHYWAIIGLIFMAGNIKAIQGYIKGLNEFRKIKSGVLNG